MSPLEQRIAAMEEELALLKSELNRFSSVPMFKPEEVTAITGILTATSSKTAASATRAVNEGGGGSYSVMFPPSGFISIGGFNVPYIN